MRKLLLCLIVLITMITPVHGMETDAPEVPESGRVYMNDEPENFTQGLLKILSNAVGDLQPNLLEAGRTCFGLIATVVLLSVVQSVRGENTQTIRLVGTVIIGYLLFHSANSMIRLGENTVKEVNDYGKLLLPALTGTLAAQGAVTSSAALYTGTAFFNSLLGALVASVIVPLLYIYLVLCLACNALAEGTLEKLKDLTKWLMTWLLKTALYIFTGYLGITGVVSGSVDAAAMKATKLTISGMVPVVGGILSDASETVLVSARMIRNSVGVYGLLAVIAIWIGPFIKIGAQYLLLKLTWAICGAFGAKENVKLIGDFSGGMGLLLGMTGTVCMLVLVSTVCFMRCVNI